MLNEPPPTGGSVATPEDRWLTPAEVAAELGVKVKTLENWRWHQLRGPAWSKVDPSSTKSRVRYLRSDLDAYKAKCRMASA